MQLRWVGRRPDNTTATAHATSVRISYWTGREERKGRWRLLRTGNEDVETTVPKPTTITMNQINCILGQSSGRPLVCVLRYSPFGYSLCARLEGSQLVGH